MICRNHVDVMEGIRRCARCQTPYCRNCLVDIQGRPYCATCKSEQLLDVRSGVSAVGVGMLQYASIWKRFGAAFLDALVLMIPVWIISFAVGMAATQLPTNTQPFANLITLPLMFVQFLYEGLMYANKNGQTLGKIAMRIRVVRIDGSPITQGQAWGRAGMKFILGCACITYIPAFFTDEKTTLHDMVAGTRVVDTL
jgi:uncharacterized RDD family membrane protein YckC